ncbi:MAG: tetratricopeptide repeat protein [Candidatus Krumholzibacteriota bacterium]|nr:tetratricopeptide repeat protein [Candidatus Krumholzibacteriota bacterium]
MRRNQAVLALLVFMLLGIFACKSVETTSAMLHNQTKNFDKAIEMATLAIEKKPDDAEAYFQLGVSYSYTGKMKMAYDSFMKAAELDPKKEEVVSQNIASNWASHYNRGLNELQAENYEGAAKEFAEATEADPRKVKSWYNLAMVYNHLSAEDSTYLEPSFESADMLMDRITEDHADYGKVLALTGRIMVKRGEDEKALEIFDKLLLFDPAKAETVEGVGNDYLRRNDYAGAIKLYEMAINAYMRAETESADVYYNLGVCYLKQEEYMKAADAYQQVIAIEPENRHAHYSLLLAYYQGEFWDEVILQGQKYTTEIAPDDPSGWQILGLTYNKKQMKTMAEKAMEKYLELTQQQ